MVGYIALALLQYIILALLIYIWRHELSIEKCLGLFLWVFENNKQKNKNRVGGTGGVAGDM